MSREHVKAFYERLATDEAFRTQIKAAGSKEKCSKIVQSAGYYFTQSEFESFTAQLLESEVVDDSLRNLSEKELEAVVGGAEASFLSLSINPMQPYGIPPDLWWRLE